MYHRILLTNDGSPLAASAVPYAAALAHDGDTEVIVLRISHAAGARPSDIDPTTWRVATAEAGHADVPLEARPLLREIVGRLRASGAERAGSIVVRGEPATAIVEVARRLEVDLIVMASHGLSGLRRAALGSVTDYVVRRAPVPVLVCHPLAPDTAFDLNVITVPLDGSTLAEGALPHAEAIARYAASRVVLVRAVPSLSAMLASVAPAGIGPGAAGFSLESAEEVVASDRAAARTALATVAERLVAGGLAGATAEVAEGPAAPAIIAAARRAGSQLIVMSSHGRGGLGRALMGSIADEVSRGFTDGAVLVVNAPDPR